ncbi:MAG: SusC/RagA family TonB-linked outer membrane protein [Mucinivorans sp.]
MKQNLPKWILCSIFCLFAVGVSSTSAMAADNQKTLNEAQAAKTAPVTVSVTDQTDNSVIGAIVAVVGTQRAMATDVNGKALMQLAPGEKIQISFLGFKPAIVTVGQSSTINVKLLEDAIGIDKVIVVGYGTTSQRKVTSSVTTINASSLQNLPVTSIAQGLAGRASGLIVTQNGGGINNNGSISIRGGSTPLAVINGVISSYSDFLLINPEDIDTFTILKDAAATAVYGSRAGDGIIVVTTKKGKGRATFSYTGEFMMTSPILLEDKASTLQRYMFDNELSKMYSRQTGAGDVWKPEVIEALRTNSDPWKYPNVDWQKEALRQMAPQQKHNISLQGGQKDNSYYLSIGILDIGTIFKENTNNQQRYNFRFQESSLIKAIGLRVTPSIEGYIEKTVAPLNRVSGGIDGYYGGMFMGIQDKKSDQLPFNKDGTISTISDNPMLGMSPDGGYHRRTNTRLRGQLDLVWSLPWVKGLDIRATGNYSTMFSQNKRWNRNAPAYNQDGTPAPATNTSLEKSTNMNWDYTMQYFVDYNRTFAQKHSLSVSAGYEAYYGYSDGLWAFREGYKIPIDQMGAGPLEGLQNGSGESENGRAGIIGRVKYDYDNRYIIEGTIRHDGNDQFPADKRWGTFFSASLAWNISSEKFFEVVREKNIFNFLKLRGSYGQTGLLGPLDGNGNPIRYAYLSSWGYEATNGWVVDGSNTPRFWEGALPSPDISWYSRDSWNIGLDFESLGSRLKGSIEYYYMTTSGYLASPSATAYTDPLGINLPTVRSNGEHRREGVDFNLSWGDETGGGFTYDVGMNFTYFDQLVSRNWSENMTDIKNPYKRRTQQSSNYYTIGYKNLGYYNNSEDVYNSVRRISSNNIVAGDLKYADINGDGKIDGEDQERIGSSTMPAINYGIFANFGYKGVFMNILFQGASDRSYYVGAEYNGNNMQNPLTYTRQLDYWTPTNRDARYPRPQGAALGNNSLNYTTSDFWLLNASYVRLKTLQVGYDFKHTLLRNTTWLSKLQLSLSGQNLFTISEAQKYGYDPESLGTTLYPAVRTFSINLSLGF